MFTYKFCFKKRYLTFNIHNYCKAPFIYLSRDLHKMTYMTEILTNNFDCYKFNATTIYSFKSNYFFQIAVLYYYILLKTLIKIKF